MSWCKPHYGVSGREQTWVNSIIQTHDMFCGCNEPIIHLVNVAIKKGGIFGFDKEKAKQLLLCHHTTTEEKDGLGETPTEEEGPGPEGNLQFGDLEKLFEEDTPFEDDDSG